MGEIIDLFAVKAARDESELKIKPSVSAPFYVWHCGCGNPNYLLTPEGPECSECGHVSISWLEEMGIAPSPLPEGA